MRRWWWRVLARELTGHLGRAVFFVSCLAVGVGAVVAVGAARRTVDQGIRSQARTLLAGDLAISSRQPLPKSLDPILAAVPHLRRSHLVEITTLAAAPSSNGKPGPSQLVELKAVDGNYPLYGSLDLEPERPEGARLDAKSCIVAPDLLTRLGLHRGDALMIGGKPFRVVASIRGEPDRLGALFSLGPRVFISLAGLARTGLITFGSRVEYQTMLALPESAPPSEIQTLASRLRREIGESHRVRIHTYRNAQPAVGSAIDRVTRFLGLVALLTLLVSGIGVAQTVRAWLAERLDAIALLRCLGVRPRATLALYLAQAMSLAAVGGLAGTALGLSTQLFLPRWLSGLVPPEYFHFWQPAAALQGLLLGLGVTLVFSLPTLATVRRIPPVRVLRHDAEPIPLPLAWRLTYGLGLVGTIWGLARFEAGSPRLALFYTAGLGATAAVLVVAALLLIRLIARFPRRRAPFTVRHGISALARPAAPTLAAIIALGMGLLVILATLLVGRELDGRLSTEMPRDAPSLFLIDIQPGEWGTVEHLLREADATNIQSVPVVTARLASIDGHPANELAAAAPRGDRRHWALSREQRLTYMEHLPKGNKITAGCLWCKPDVNEVSVADDFAHDLKLHLGSRLVFNIQGVSIPVTVTSLRHVDWGTFGINFFFVVEPGVLEHAPHTRLATAEIPAGNEQRFEDALAASYPHITPIRVRQIVDKVRGVLTRIALGVRALGGVVIMAGLLILAGAVAATAMRREREVALLKTLGVTRRGVMAMHAVEYAIAGLVAGIIGLAGGTLIAWLALVKGMGSESWSPSPTILLLTLAGGILLSCVAGLLASARALTTPPARILRGD